MGDGRWAIRQDPISRRHSREEGWGGVHAAQWKVHLYAVSKMERTESPASEFEWRCENHKITKS